MKKIFFYFLIFISLTKPVFALSIPEKPQGYVNDYAGLLSPSVRQDLENTLASFDRETSNQITLAIFPSLEGEVLEDFSIRLADKWKPGAKKNNNGVILLIFKNDRKMRLEVGYGLEGALPDATCKLIIQREIVPYFRQGNFDEGVLRAVAAITQATKGEYKSGEVPHNKINSNLMLFLVILLVVLGPRIMRYLLLAEITGETMTSRGRHRGGAFGGGFFSGGFGGGGFGGGGGGFSGGGGGFGGGGASGGW